MGHTTVAIKDETFKNLKSLKERLEKERGGHWTYSDVIKFLLKESGEYVE